MSDDRWKTCDVTLGDVRYPYSYGVDCLPRIVDALSRLETDIFLVVTDDTVLARHGDALLQPLRRCARVCVLTRPAGEAMKTMSQLAAHFERALEAGATRRSVVVTFGGGVPGNLGGLLAALLFRGIRLVHVPTTTVAAMDSVLSLKQAINSPYGKNHIGAYHVPTAVFADVKLLQTLPERELRSGLCEAAKNCLAIRPESLERFREMVAGREFASVSALLSLLEESVATKVAITRCDAREQRSGLALEYGHTVGHAIELCDERHRGSSGLAHGEAVAIGMIVAARIAASLGALSDEAVGVHEELVSAVGVRAELPPGADVAEVLAVVRNDNKRGYLDLSAEETAMVLLRDLGVPMGAPDLPLARLPIALVERELIALA